MLLWRNNNTTDEKVGKLVSIKGNTVRKIRKRVLSKVKKEYLKLKREDKNDI